MFGTLLGPALFKPIAFFCYCFDAFMVQCWTWLVWVVWQLERRSAPRTNGFARRAVRNIGGLVRIAGTLQVSQKRGCGATTDLDSGEHQHPGEDFFQ